MHASKRLIAFLKTWELFRPRMYNDAARHCTIGYGHRIHRGPVGTNPMAEQPFRDGITEGDAEALLTRDVRRAEWAVSNLVTAHLTQNQFDVLCSFVFNVGAGNFEESTLRRLLNDRKYDAVPNELEKWVHAHGMTLLGLVRRRAAEAAWWQEA